MSFNAASSTRERSPRGNGTIVVFDLEYTAWMGSMQWQWKRPGEHREVVAIGAVKLSANEGHEEIDWMSCLVKPRINPMLSHYFTDLTGITQERLDDEGTSFSDGLMRFMDFVGKDASVVFSNGGDDEVIRENCELEKVPFPFPVKLFRDARPLIVQATGLKDSEVDSFRLPELFGLRHNHRAHDALDDARAVAGALRAIWNGRSGSAGVIGGLL